MDNPDAGPGGAIQQTAQRQQLRVMQKPDVRLQPAAPNCAGHIVQTAVVDGELVIGKFAGRALQHIVDALGDGEKTSVRRRNHGAPGVHAQGVAQRHQRMEDFRHAAAVGRAVDVDDAPVAEPLGQLRQAAGRFRRQQVKVTAGIDLGILNKINQPGCLRLRSGQE